ncbi:MAG: hypothetical protein RML38_08600 [Bacteroidia bacterium]|nr:hypothetical protein [Bacteroidia bacterium]
MLLSNVPLWAAHFSNNEVRDERLCISYRLAEKKEKKNHKHTRFVSILGIVCGILSIVFLFYTLLLAFFSLGGGNPGFAPILILFLLATIFAALLFLVLFAPCYALYFILTPKV